MKYFNLIIVINFLLIFQVLSQSSSRYIFVDKDAAKKLNDENPDLVQEISQSDEVTILKVKTEKIEEVASKLHQITGRCGNFTDEGATQDHAMNQLQNLRVRLQEAEVAKNLNLLLAFPSISRQSEVVPLLNQVKEQSIKFYIDQLSAFPTRFWQSSYSYLASEKISSFWKYLTRNRNDAQVELIGHRWKQPSVSLTLKGKSNKKIIIGGHLDSINSKGTGGVTEHAPGADDDASGVATITEIIRVLMEAQYQPENTLVFYAYAAEEVGLKGSEDIAVKSKNAGNEVLAVLQLDMTNYKGSDKVIYFDNTASTTHAGLSSYLGSLIDEYLKVPWGSMTCNYGCSDHASWTKQGYPAAFPFEAGSINASNPYIHSDEDRLSVTNDSASHSVHFAKLGISFLLEMDKP